MKQNLIVSSLIVIALVEGLVILADHSKAQVQTTAAPQPSQRPAPMFLTKGAKLSDSPLMKYAVLIAPGTLSDAAKQSLSGFDINTQAQHDGSLLVRLTPHDSDDQNQQYVVKSGEKLYFIEQTPVDDNPGNNTDSNLRDDYGVIVDSNGIVL